MSAPATMLAFIPLTIRKRNGRPKIVPPADIATDSGGAGPHVLKAIAKAWSWRRKLESGAVANIEDIAHAEAVTPAYIRRMLELAYLAPEVLEKNSDRAAFSGGVTQAFGSGGGLAVDIREGIGTRRKVRGRIRGFSISTICQLTYLLYASGD